LHQLCKKDIQLNQSLRKHEFTLCFTFAHAASIAIPARVATSAMKSSIKSLLTPEDEDAVTTRMSNFLRFQICHDNRAVA